MMPVEKSAGINMPISTVLSAAAPVARSMSGVTG